MPISTTQYYYHQQPFTLESGIVLQNLHIAFHTYGKLNETKDNVIWICHALTANSDVADWWPGMVGESLTFDTEKNFIVCANVLGSCYGTNAEGLVKENELPPLVTIRDMVQVHILLRKYLSIEKIALLIGGSMGGYQALEWTLTEPEVIEKQAIMVTSAAESAWGIAIHTAQRLAIEADATWLQKGGGINGIKAARGFGMVSYRTYQQYLKTQTDPEEKTDGFKATSYIIHQGNKLAQRFDARHYWLLTKSMDSHNIARGRGGNVGKVLDFIKQPSLVVGISSDILCPAVEQKALAEHLPNSSFFIIDSDFGHDGFLTETEKVGKILRDWMAGFE
jgi:homoserine O-acetyltransferase